MKLKDSFITYMAEDVQIMVSAGENAFHGMVRSNKTAAFIIDCLKTPCDEASIVDRLAQKYDAPRSALERDVAYVVKALKQIGALDA